MVCYDIGLDTAICPCVTCTMSRALSHPAMGGERQFDPLKGGGQRLPAFAPAHLSTHASLNTTGAQRNHV